MVGERVQGLADAYAMFGAIPDAAREQVGVEMAIIARDYLALQQEHVPVDTGALLGGLGIQLMLDRLRVRVGLNNLTGGRSALFYGRIVEFGRSAQTVLVQRRRPGTSGLRNRRKRLEDIAATYSLRVKARAPQPFVLLDDAVLDEIATERLVDFWADVLGKAGAAA